MATRAVNGSATSTTLGSAMLKTVAFSSAAEQAASAAPDHVWGRRWRCGSGHAWMPGGPPVLSRSRHRRRGHRRYR